jgi:hypothetical protein
MGLGFLTLREQLQYPPIADPSGYQAQQQGVIDGVERSRILIRRCLTQVLESSLERPPRVIVSRGAGWGEIVWAAACRMAAL